MNKKIVFLLLMLQMPVQAGQEADSEVVKGVKYDACYDLIIEIDHCLYDLTTKDLPVLMHKIPKKYRPCTDYYLKCIGSCFKEIGRSWGHFINNYYETHGFRSTKDLEGIKCCLLKIRHICCTLTPCEKSDESYYEYVFKKMHDTLKTIEVDLDIYNDECHYSASPHSICCSFKDVIYLLKSL